MSHISPQSMPNTLTTRPKKRWQPPTIVLEFSLVAQAQDPFGEDGKQVEQDPFLGAFTTSGV